MNYKKIYDSLIVKAQNRAVLEGYKEKHHIIPKCMGGTNKGLDIVNLTAREHYIAHWLLHKTYPKHQGLIYALYIMMYGKRKKYLNLSSKEYENIKMKRSKILSERMIGENHPMWNKKHKPESLQKMSDIKKGKKHSLKTLQKMSESQLGDKNHNWNKSASLKTRKKQSKARKNKKHKLKTILDIRKNNKNCKKIMIDGVEYQSIREAGRRLDEDRATISYRLKSENFPNYKYV
jgi:hypothetical protein